MKNYRKRLLGAACLGASTVCVGDAHSATLVFREGLGSYAGTQDTWFSNRASEAGGFPEGAFVRTAMWGTPPLHEDGANQQGLVRFDSLFGAGSGQIPLGSTITGATLRMHVPSDIAYSDGEANAVHQMLVDWAEADAFDATQWTGGASGHIDRNDVEAAATPVADSTAFAVGNVIPQGTTLTYDVTSILQSWSAGSSNFGFLLQSLGAAAGDGLYMASSEYAGADGEEARPTLIIEGDFPGNVVDLTIDRDTGNASIFNGTGIAINEVLGYTISSEAGSLDQAGWLSVANNYDQSSGGPVDTNDNWTIVSDPSSHTDLSEFELEGGDGGVLTDGLSLDLGNVWIKSPVEDIEIVLVKTDGNELNVNVSFTGNGGSPFEPADFNFDGVVTAADWPTLRDNHFVDFGDVSQAQAYQLGDLDGDLDNDELDYLIFKGLFEDANGAGSFGAMLATVPEPGSITLVACAVFALACRPVWRRMA